MLYIMFSGSIIINREHIALFLVQVDKQFYIWQFWDACLKSAYKLQYFLFYWPWVKIQSLHSITDFNKCFLYKFLHGRSVLYIWNPHCRNNPIRMYRTNFHKCRVWTCTGHSWHNFAWHYEWLPLLHSGSTFYSCVIKIAQFRRHQNHTIKDFGYGDFSGTKWFSQVISMAQLKVLFIWLYMNN